MDTSQKLLHPGEKPPMAGLCSHVEKKRDLRSSSRDVFTNFPNTNLPNTYLVFCYQNWSDLLREKTVLFSDWEKLLKFEAEDRELAKFLRSLEQFL